MLIDVEAVPASAEVLVAAPLTVLVGSVVVAVVEVRLASFVDSFVVAVVALRLVARL